MKSEVLVLTVCILLLFGCAMQENNHTNSSSDKRIGQLDNDSKGSDQSVKITVIQTNKGDIEIELYEDSAPITVGNFVDYVDSGFYNRTIFHRVIPGFMIQGGGFTTQGRQKQTNPPIILESNNGLSNSRGTIAMARTSDPNSATSQFFINTADNPSLDRSPENEGYAVFGKVVSGMDVVDEIEGVQTGIFQGYQDWPIETVLIEKVYIK